MKRLLLALSVSTALSLQAAKTDPVGVVTITINGGNPAFTPISVPLQQAESASLVVASVTTNTLTFDGSPFSGQDFSDQDYFGDPLFYIELLDGVGSGNILDVVSNTDNSLTIDVGTDDLTTVLAAGNRILIREHFTIASFFGENNEAGLTSGGGDTESDLIYIMEPSGSGQYDRIFYYQTDNLGFLGGTGWRLSGGSSSVNVGNTRIDPDQGIIVQRIEPDDLSISIVGDVRVSDSLTSIPRGFVSIGTSLPVPVRLADSNLYTGSTGGINGGGNDTEADLVYIINPDGTFNVYYYQIDNLGFLGGTGWRESGVPNIDAGTTTIPAGSSIIIFSRDSETHWQLPNPYKDNI